MKKLSITFSTTVVLMLMLMLTGVAFAETKVTFDKFQNITNIKAERTPMSDVTLGGGESADPLVTKVDMGVSFSCEGKSDFCRPKSVQLLFVAYTAKWVFGSQRKIILLIDGTPENAGTRSWNGSVIGAHNLVEFVSTSISPELLAKLALAKTVDVQIDLFEVSLTDKNLAAIKDIASHMKPSQSKP